MNIGSERERERKKERERERKRERERYLLFGIIQPLLQWMVKSGTRKIGSGKMSTMLGHSF